MPIAVLLLRGLSRHASQMRMRAVERLRDDRGDVPGWVLITLMNRL